jgi:hypothetical protein
MARTTATDVKVIIDTNLSDSIVNAFISDANLLVTNVFGISSGLSDATLTSIEKWISAHFIATTRDRQASEEYVKDAKIKYTGITGTGLESTFYGQQALTLDTTGLLRKSTTTKLASMFAVSSPEDTNWDPRVVN